jgi:DNA (cytosine-5)-methyltransferase 1
MAGAEIAAGLDLWSSATETYKQNFPDAHVWNKPIQDVSPNSVAKKIGKMDLLLASPECTNHSPAKGSRPRCEGSRETAFQVVRFAKHFEPRWIVIENVMQMRRWHRYDELLQKLRSLGYTLREQVLNAADFSVPQSRRRLFITGDLKRSPPENRAGTEAPKTVDNVLDRTDRFPFTPLRRPGRAQNTLDRADRAIAELGTDTAFLIVYYGSDGAGGWQRLDLPLRTITTVDRFALVMPIPGGHVMRMLQPPELKAAMGMPPDFALVGSTRRERIHMIGNAVCPPLMANVVSTLCAERIPETENSHA